MEKHHFVCVGLPEKESERADPAQGEIKNDLISERRPEGRVGLRLRQIH